MTIKYKNSFVDYMRRKYNYSTVMMYTRLKWERTRYYNFCKRETELARSEMWVLARALGIPIEQVYQDECHFYHGPQISMEKRKSQNKGLGSFGEGQQISVAESL